MNIIKPKQIVVLIAIVLSFTQCNNTTKGVEKELNSLGTETKNEVSKVKNSINEKVVNDKMYFGFKVEHAKALLEIEEAKTHFILENDKFKAEEDLKKAEKHLSNLEKISDNNYQKFIAKMKADITATKQSIKNDDKTAKIKLEKLSNEFSSEIKKLENKISSEKINISNDAKRHYAELRAKEYLLKAKYVSDKKETYAKIDEYLDKADKEYLKAKQYGNEKYKSTIEDLRKDIKTAKKSIQAKNNNAKKDINHVITKLGSFSEQMNVDYPYILIP